MPLRLRVIPSSRSKGRARKQPAGERAIEFADGVGQIRIGRRSDLELSLPYSPLSGVHARLVRAGGDNSAGGQKNDHWLLEDLGSTNGTFVGGERLKPGVKHALTAGTQIALAQVKLIFDGEVPGTEATETYVRRQISDLFSPGPAAATAPFLTVVSGVKGGATFRFVERNRHYTIGRARACDFRIKADEVSREHAAFTWRDEGVEVADLGSINGVIVNGERALEPKRLYDGDLVQVGPVKLRLFNPGEDPAAALADPSAVRITPASETAAVDLSSAFRARLHAAVAGTHSAEHTTRLPSASSRYVYIVVIAAAVMMGVAALVGGLTAR